MRNDRETNNGALKRPNLVQNAHCGLVIFRLLVKICAAQANGFSVVNFTFRLIRSLFERI
jgi:hypothetical protein